MRKIELVRSAEDVLHNIGNFEGELAKHPALHGVLTRVHAWYALQQADGSWLLGPSKFVGYRNNDGRQYLSTYNSEGGAHGGKTERVLETWFREVPPQTSLGRELTDALREFLKKWNRAPRKSLRISVLKSELDKVPAVSRAPGARSEEDLLARISSDPSICGGRPCIKGTRMRVSDIVDLMAHGATGSEILEDYPYLAENDLAAALAYAARAVDHRVVRAA